MLDDIAEFGKGEQVILSREESGAESFPLIRVEIRKNRKTVLSDTVGKSGKGKPKFEVHLRRYTNEAMGLSSSQPSYDENGNVPKGYRFEQYLLGERYLFTYIDQEPDCSALERKYERSIIEKQTQIDNKYASIIASELERYMESVAPKLDEKYQKLFAEYERDLAASLERDIAENNDREVRESYEREIIAPIRRAVEAEHAELQKKLKNLKDEQSDEAAALREKINSCAVHLEELLSAAQKQTPVSSYYIARNQRRLEEKKKSLAISRQAEFDRIYREQQNNLQRQYKSAISAEKTEVEESLKKQLNDDKVRKIEDETIRCYKIYFRPADSTDRPNEIQKQIEGIAPKYLIYDNRAERAKIERQERALKSINEGYVRNPFLASYLFAPETLRAGNVSEQESDWYLESLNERQKLAVRRALASESLFLLQGPPGTGKTQVIAELIAQFAKRGKKVLISSETHKAIDNVFERLPKIPEIRPLRLIPSQNKKETNYSPEKLVDNFYKNIADTLERQISRYEHFEETKATFNEEIGRLRTEYEKLLRLKQQNIEVEKERNLLTAAINRLNVEHETLRAELSLAKERTELWRRTKSSIDKFKFTSEDVDGQALADFQEKCKALCGTFDFLRGTDISKIGEVARLNPQTVREEISVLLSDDKIARLETERKQLRGKLLELRDPDTDEPPIEGTENFELYKRYQSELIEIGKEIKLAKEDGGFDVAETITMKLFPAVVAHKELLSRLPEELAMFQIRLRGIISDSVAAVDEKISQCQNSESDIQQKIVQKQAEISHNKRDYEQLSENTGIEEYSELNSSLKQRVARFFRNFGIVREYDPTNLETAFDIIAEEWRRLEYDHKRTEDEDRKKIPVYREIAKYLLQADILDDDRRAYTRELYDCVNVFGITCTSRDRFTNLSWTSWKDTALTRWISARKA